MSLVIVPLACLLQAAPVGAQPTPTREPTADPAPAGEEAGALPTVAREDEQTLGEAEAARASATLPVAEPVSKAPVDSEAEIRAEKNSAEIAELKEELAALRSAQEETELRALSQGAEDAAQQDLLSIYGFMDVGLQRYWVDDRSLVASYFDTNATTFMLGNVDFYFDANPHPDWRGLAEIRFTNAPHGQVENPGNLGGTFERTSTQQYDPHGTSLNAPMWGGSTVIERAWIEWKRHQSFRLRAGNFFTPFGIWNLDHGTPTLISLTLPQFIQQRFMPLRQTGLQALGSFFFDNLELGYHAWLTNGRTELSNFDFNDDKAVGGRLFLQKSGDKVTGRLGTSYHHGRVADKIVNLDSISPLEFSNEEGEAYVENAFGVDLSLDVGRTRLRAEGTAQLQQWEEGKRKQLSYIAPIPNASLPDHWRYAAYAVLAHELPWGGIEPYVYGEIVQQQWELPDLFTLGSVGFNVRFTPAVTLKAQVTKAWFFDWMKETAGDPSLNNTTGASSRLVMAF